MSSQQAAHECVADQVLPGLKEFQRRTVEHVFHHLYESRASSRRFLVADEVGLGKTMVARGIVAKAIDRLRADGVRRIDVIYVCSNQVIARQNISKLMVAGEEHKPVLDRITMLPAHLHDLDQNDVNLIPLTPYTSLDLRSNTGMRRERVVLWYLLRRVFGGEFMKTTGARRALRGGTKLARFKRGIQEDPWQWSRERRLDPELANRFVEDLRRDRKEEGRDSLLRRFRRVAKGLDKKDDDDLAWEATQIVGELRRRLAASCIAALEPDLIILDEFQRFRSLMSPDSAAGELAQLLFAHERARVLLLSATPYKMVTRDFESGEDHHKDFLETVRFLTGGDGAKVGECRAELRKLRGALREGRHGKPQAIKAKRQVETLLRPVMCRTERLAVDGDRNGMIIPKPLDNLELRRSDVQAYAALDKVSRSVGQGDPIEYWKSTPYPLNFMDEYMLARRFEEQAEDSQDARLQVGILDTDAVTDFKRLDLGNPRLRAIAADTVDRGLWKLLWLPPALPYYAAGKPYDKVTVRQPTKRLVFSAWNVVPKAISLMLSYEAERNLVAMGEHRRNTADERASITQPLKLALEGGKAASMSTFALMLPSAELAELADPLEMMRFRRGADASIREVLSAAEKAIEPRVRKLIAQASGKGRDSSWYAAVPLLLECDRVGRDQLLDWLRSEEVREIVAARVKKEDPESSAGGAAAWLEHLERAQSIVMDPSQLGHPPADLRRILALMAIGSPATAALRAISRIAPDATPDQARTQAMKSADALRGMFNWPEVVPLIRWTHSTKEYWKDTLHYCVNGNLQAVLDEYAHVLSEWAPMPGSGVRTADDIVEGVSDAMVEALALHGADYEVRKIDSRGAPEAKPLRMRPRFALRFADPRGSERVADRATNVRASFNSPFWPFVLASTSVGQEGLDFHLYSHAIVHWNLPANPVDFEQREGRVHRYKGHAIRLNLASLHAHAAVQGSGPDPWADMFAAADEADGGLCPFWVLNEGETKILRYVPALPWSWDARRHAQIEKLLGVYRLAFGQPRQDDLLAYLPQTDLTEEEIRALTIDLSP